MFFSRAGLQPINEGSFRQLVVWHARSANSIQSSFPIDRAYLYIYVAPSHYCTSIEYVSVQDTY